MKRVQGSNQLEFPDNTLQTTSTYKTSIELNSAKYLCEVIELSDYLHNTLHIDPDTISLDAETIENLGLEKVYFKDSNFLSTKNGQIAMRAIGKYLTT